MIGKLHVWRGERGDHKKEQQDERRVLPGEKDPPLNKSAAPKRAPRLSVGKRSFSLGPSKPDEVSFLPQLADQDLSLFSNIPAIISAGLDRPSSSSGSQPSPSRPRTADPDNALHPLPFRTAPALPTPTEAPRLPWADTLLPLTIDFDQSRTRSSSRSSQRRSIQTPQDESRSSYAASISRPKTSSSLDPSHRRKGSGSISRPLVATPTYSLSPTITPQHSRRPSITGIQNQSYRLSQSTLTKSNSTASTNGFGPSNRASSSSRPSINTQNTPKASSLRSPIEQSSILDEVEGALNATLTELQELQSESSEDTSNPSAAARKRPTEIPKSAPPQQGYFGQISQSIPTSNSLPPTPLVAVSNLGEHDDRFQSLQSDYDKQKRNLHTMLVENETMKKQLSLTQTRLADIDTIRIERDQFEQRYQESQINGRILVDKLKLSREKEEETRNSLSECRSKLEDANLHRLDVLHHHHELEEEMRILQEKYEMLRVEKERVEQKRLSFEADRSVLHQEIARLPLLHQEISKLRQRPQQRELDDARNSLRASEERARKLEMQLGNDRSDLPSIVADLGFKMEDLQRGLHNKDSRIEELEATNILLTKNAKVDKNYANKLRGLERTVAEQHKTFRMLQAERDQLRQLLHTEFRRSANDVQGRQHTVTTMLEKKVEIDSAIQEVRKRAQEFLRQQKRREDDPDAVRTARIEELHQEIDYHVKDIVLYKLDVKGYKKDLKRAQTKLARLEAIYSHDNGAMSQYSSKDSSATRPSVSSHDSQNSVHQIKADIFSEDESSALEQRNGKRLSVHNPPDTSPAPSPKRERKGLNFVGAGI